MSRVHIPVGARWVAETISIIVAMILCSALMAAVVVIYAGSTTGSI